MFQLLVRRSLVFAQIAVVICILAMSTAQAHSDNHVNEHNVMKAIGGDFFLMSSNGPVELSDFSGKVVAIYFGYTHCTDACPLDLGKLGRALKSMKPDEVEQIQPIFITLDPARDNAKRLATYSESFHPKLIGLTSSETEIAAVAKAYGVSYEKGPVNSAGEYDIEHPSDIFLVGRDGALLRSLPKGVSPARIAAALHKVLHSKKP